MTEYLRIIVFCRTSGTKNLIINYFYNNVLLSLYVKTVFEPL